MKKSLLFAAGFALAVLPMSAQKLVEGYVTMPGSTDLHTYVNAWNGGSGTIKVNGLDWEDEEFFISRVKPKARYFNTATQVRPDLTQHSAGNFDGTDKRYLNWVPINDPSFNAIPNGTWDQEVFSMWSYVDHWGDWTSPFGWVPGAFADVAHKNGVAVSGLASVPNSSISTAWANCFDGIVSAGGDKVGKFLFYHGVDGLGYNSEWTSGYSPTGRGLTTFHNNLLTYMNNAGNSIFENIWYNGVTDSGSCSFDYALTNGTSLLQASSMFMNYNWNSESRMSQNVSTMKNTVGRDPFFIYAGMNQQGGEPYSGTTYPTLAKYQYSIGMWGAHSHNMFWEGRGTAGSSVEATQRYYIDQTEAWYTGGSLNPAIKQAITTVRNHRPTDSWAGISSMVSARTTLSWDLTKEPFFSFFNLGNGKFFNWKGERVSDNPWYSIGIQDYLPTWRYWFAPEFMQTDVTAGTVSLNAAFTWDDAYFGGSCLKITGSSAKEYLHLFKTNFTVNAQTKLRVTFKILGGKADVKVACRNNATTAGTYNVSLFTADECAAIEDNSYNEGAAGWTTKEVTLGSRTFTNLGVLALCFENAENLELLLGGVEIVRSTFTTPAAPTIVSSKVLNNSYTGVDGKIIWKMGTPVAGEPTYNSDVNVSMFKVYSREGEDGEPVFLGATTSWAAIAFRAPNTDASKQIQFGVSAVSMDTNTESEISWGASLAKGTYTPSEDIEINKTIIKPYESFEVRYVDQNHGAESWVIADANGSTVASGTGTRLEVSDGLPLGFYDLKLGTGTDQRIFGSYVQITGEGVGALPEIYTIARDSEDVTDGGTDVEIALTDTPTLSYTGRKSDGSASRALSLASRYIGVLIGDLGIGGTYTPISVAGWFKFNAIPEKSWNFMNISNKGATWPQNTWGWAWNHGDSEGHILCTFRGSATDSGSPGELHYEFPNTVLQPNVWTHIAWVVEYNGTGVFRCLLYINGVKQESRWTEYTFWNAGNGGSVKTTGTTDDYCTGRTYQYSNNDRIYFGGAAHMGSSIDGIVDDFQVWSKSMTEEDVKLSMSGITAENCPEGVMCLWDFESDPASDNGFNSIGSKAGVKAYSYDYAGNAESGGMVWTPYEPVYTNGCPVISGTAYPVTTQAVWKDSDRHTAFTATTTGATAGEAGTADVQFVSAGDHEVTLSLENSYGSSSKTFPVYIVTDETQGIGDIAADGNDLEAYTVDNVLFLEFVQDGAYDIEVYNTAGMLVGAKKLNAIAGQNARITLGAAGVYLVKASVNGQAIRTIKVLSK